VENRGLFHGFLCDVIRRKRGVLMLEGDAFQGWFTFKGNEEKIIVLNVECGCGCRDGTAAYDPKDCLMAKAIMGRE